VTNDEQHIRDLVQRWAAAVHGGDLDGVLADHASDIVMFDVPPPYQGVRGIADYEQTWPEFFTWQANGASFDIESLEVTPARTWPTRTPCSAAAPHRSSPTTRRTGCG
jgi:ketosteroid isomerase-like protein